MAGKRGGHITRNLSGMLLLLLTEGWLLEVDLDGDEGMVASCGVYFVGKSYC
jgi:hypothetical protein